MNNENDGRFELRDHTEAAAANPNHYDGTIVNLAGTVLPIQKAAENIECGAILEREGRWAISDYGVECLAIYYSIRRDRVHEMDWKDHLGVKTWFDEEDKKDFSIILEKAKAKWPK